jgi:predicted MFS family arabinose efflux permease
MMLFAVVYAGISFASETYQFYLLFFIYALYAAATEGVSKAWITNISDKKDKATAIGFYSSFQSIAALLASSFCGLLWFYGGSTLAFLITSVAAIISAIYLSIFTLQTKKG